jgi:acetate kinase
MIIRHNGNHWMLSRHQRDSLLSTFEEIVAEIKLLPASEPVGILCPCDHEELRADWSPVTFAVINSLTRGVAPLSNLQHPILALAGILLESFSPAKLWLGNDSALYSNLPEAAQRFAISPELGGLVIKRTGVDGLAHDWLVRHTPDANVGKSITIHLCNQPTLTAFHDGKAIETSTGFSGLEGLGGKTNCGQLDPGLALLFAREVQDGEKLDHIFRLESGWNGYLNRPFDLVDMLSDHDIEIKSCQEIFSRQLLREIGAMAAVLGGADRIIFFGRTDPVIIDWMKAFRSDHRVLSDVPQIWVDYADWMLEATIPC